MSAEPHAHADAPNPADEQYLVVMNDEEQYSIWAAGRPIPPGWHASGTRGTRQECLEHIDREWTDMRPKSLRLAMADS